MSNGVEITSPWIKGSTSDGRFAGVDVARAFAALSVLVFHAIPYFFDSSNNPLLQRILINTRFGVPILFVISGFVLTHSLARSSYHPHQLGWHLLQRISRLYLPFIACHFLWLSAHWFGSRLITRGSQDFEPDWNQFLANLSWMPGSFGFEWCQYHFYVLPIFVGCYCILGVAFPWMTTRRISTRLPLIALASAWALQGDPGTLATCFPAFLLGVTFHHSTSPMNRMEKWTLLVELTALLLVIAWSWGPERALGCGLGSLLLLRSQRCPAWIQYLAGISYSIFLVHPLCIEIIGLQSRKWSSDSAWMKSGFFIASLFCSVGLAAVFHRCFEFPGLSLAQKIKKFGNSALAK